MSSEDPAELYPLQRSAGMLLFVGCSPPNHTSAAQLRSVLLIYSQYHI